MDFFRWMVGDDDGDGLLCHCYEKQTVPTDDSFPLFRCLLLLYHHHLGFGWMTCRTLSPLPPLLPLLPPPLPLPLPPPPPLPLRRAY